MKFVTLIILMTLALVNSSEARRRGHSTSRAAAKTLVLGACADFPKTCSDLSDKYLECTATAKGQRFEEGAYDSDNLECVSHRLWKKICARGLESLDVKANCR